MISESLWFLLVTKSQVLFIDCRLWPTFIVEGNTLYLVLLPGQGSGGSPVYAQLLRAASPPPSYTVKVRARLAGQTDRTQACGTNGKQTNQKGP